MYIPKLRRINDALEEIKKIDPDCPLTWYSLRELCQKVRGRPGSPGRMLPATPMMPADIAKIIINVSINVRTY